MKFAALVLLSTVALAMAQGESSLPSELKFGDLGDFKLESGAIIRNCRIGYHTLGKLNEDTTRWTVVLLSSQNAAEGRLGP